jgi:CBS domain containing-hemolysin-like protein
MLPVSIVPETMAASEVLTVFIQQNKSIALVVDEFGGTSGIVTLEDIMEEIIGDIKDEFDEDDPMFRKIDEHNFLFEGKTLINDMCRMIGVPTDTFEDIRGESDSLGGLILEISGKFPAVNETVSYEQYEFTVLEVDKMRIRRVKVTVNELTGDEEE